MSLELVGLVSHSRFASTARSQAPPVLRYQLQKDSLTASPFPAIALNAAYEPLAVVVDFDELMAAITFTEVAHFSARGLLALFMAETVCPLYRPHHDIRCDAEDAKDDQDTTNG